MKHSNRWKGGRTKHSMGYIWVYSPTHPYREKKGYVLEHRLVVEKKLGRYLLPNEEVDHINGITSDNRTENLRVCSSSQNKWNARMHKDNTSGYKGVCWDKAKNLWIANITIYYKTKYLGGFHNKIEAAKAYNNAALKYHGEFARLNII